MEIQAFAKLNLTLDVLGKRPDGYHDLRMVMQSITLCDTLTLTSNQGQGLRVSTDLHFLPTGEKNPGRHSRPPVLGGPGLSG